MAYLGRHSALAGLTSSDIPDNSITSAKIVDGAVAVADLANNYDDKIQANIALLAFKTAVNGSLAKYNLQDQIVDEFVDATGINAGDSTNESLSDGSYQGGVHAIPTITGGGGSGASNATGGAGGTGSGGVATGTGGTGSNGVSAGVISNGGDGSGTLIGAGGGGGGQGSAASTTDKIPTGGNGSATHYTGGGGGGGIDGDGANFGPALGGSGYKTGGTGANVTTASTDGIGATGTGTAHGGGEKGLDGLTRKNSGGGGGWPGGGGGGIGDPGNSSSSGQDGGGGGGATGGVIITYTDSSSNPQVILKFSGTSYTVPAGATDLTVYAVGAGGSGSAYSGSSGGGGGGGGVAKSATISNAGGVVVNYTIGTAGARSTSATGNDGGPSTATVAATYADLTLQSSDTTAEAVPTKADLIVLIEDAGSGVGTVNTHIKGWVSRYETGGTKTWTQGTLVDEGDWGTDKRILAFHDLDISSQASGTQMAYKITTHSASAVYNTKIHATSLGWR